MTPYVFILLVGVVAFLATPCLGFADSEEDSVSLSQLMRQLQDGRANFSSIRAHLPQMIHEFGAATYDDASQELSHEQYQTIFIPKQHAKRLVTSSQEVSSEIYPGVQGRPGIDFPVLQAIPKTGFSCRNVKSSGYYADLETDCQVFHICADGRKISFLCPNGTIFRQSHLICDWWWTVDCASSKEFYEESAEQLANDQRVYSARARAAQQQHAKAIAEQNESKISPNQNQYRNVNNGRTEQYQREHQGTGRGSHFRTNQFTESVSNGAQQNRFTSSKEVIASHEITSGSSGNSPSFQLSGQQGFVRQNIHINENAPNRQLGSGDSSFNRRGKQRQEVKNNAPSNQQTITTSQPKALGTEYPVFRSTVTPSSNPVRSNQKRMQTVSSEQRLQYERQNKAVFQDRERQQSAETASFVGSRGNNNILFQNQRPASVNDNSSKTTDSSKQGRGFRFTTTTDVSHQLNVQNHFINNQYRETTPKANSGETPFDTSYGSNEERYSSEEGSLTGNFPGSNTFYATETTTKIYPNTNNFLHENSHKVTDSTFHFRINVQTESPFSYENNKEYFEDSSSNFESQTENGKTRVNQEQTTEFVKSTTELPILKAFDSETSDFDYRTTQTETTDLLNSRFKNFISKNRSPEPSLLIEPHNVVADNTGLSSTFGKNPNFIFENSTLPTTNYDKNFENNPGTFTTDSTFVNELTERTGVYQNSEGKSDRDKNFFPSDTTTASSTKFETDDYYTDSNESEFATEGNFNITPEVTNERNVKNRTKVLAYSSINFSQSKARSSSGRSLSINDDREHLMVSSSSGIRSSGRNLISSLEKSYSKNKLSSVNNYSTSSENYENRLSDSSSTTLRDRYIDVTIEPTENKVYETSPLDSVTQISPLNETRTSNRNIAQPKNVNVVIIQQTSIIKDSSESPDVYSTTVNPRTGRKGFHTEDINDVDIEKQRIDLVSTTPITGHRRYRPTTQLPAKQNDKPPATETLTSKIPQLIQLTRDLLPPKYDDPYPTVAQEIPVPGDYNVLSDAEVNEYSSSNRLGLNIPPSSGPGALHSLSVYFATRNITENTTPTNTVSQVDSIVSSYTKEDSLRDSKDREKLQQSESASIPPLLTELTKNSYNELFPSNKQKSSTIDESTEEVVQTASSGTTSRNTPSLLSTQPVRNQIRAKEIESTLKELEENFENVITGYSTLKPEMSSSTTGTTLKGNEQNLLTNDTPNLRALAQVFSKALSAYLDNPEEFRKALSELRPSEPNTIEESTYRIPIETSSVTGINTEYPSVTKEEEEVLDFSDVTPSNGNRKHASRGRKTGKNQNIPINNYNDNRNPDFAQRQNVENSVNSYPSGKTTTELYSANLAGFSYETLQNSQSQYPKTSNNVAIFNSIHPEHNTEGQSFYSQFSGGNGGADYTLPPGTTQYTGPTYGPNIIETSTLSNLDTTVNDQPRYGGFQNNSVKIEIAIHNQGGFENHNPVNTFPQSTTTDVPTKLNSVVTSFTNDVVAATTFSPVIKYVLQSDRDHPPTALVPPNSNESPWTQQINKEVVIDEILGPFIPQDLNNLAEGLINLPTASGEEKMEPTQSLLHTPVAPETSTFKSSNRSKHRKASNSQVIRIFVETDSDSGSLKLSTSSRKIDSNDDESLIVAPSSGFGSSILNQLSASKTIENAKNIGQERGSINSFPEDASADISTTTLDTTYVTDATSTPIPVSTRMEFTKSETTSRVNVTKQSRKSKSRRPSTIQTSEKVSVTNLPTTIIVTTEEPQTKTRKKDNNLENSSVSSVRRQKNKIGEQLQNFGQRITKSTSSPIQSTTTTPIQVTEKIKSQTKSQNSHESVPSKINITTTYQAESDAREKIIQGSKTQSRTATPQDKPFRNLVSRNGRENDNKNGNTAMNTTTGKRNGNQRTSKPEVNPLSTEISSSTSKPRRVKSSRRKSTLSSESVTQKTELPLIYLPTTIKKSDIEEQSTVFPLEAQTKSNRKLDNRAKSTVALNDKAVTESLHEAMSTIDRVQAHPEEMQTLENLLMKAGRKGQMGLNDTSATALINVMRDAASNSTVRRLFLFLVNDNMKNSSLQETRSHLVDALLQLPVDVIGTASKPSLTIKQPSHQKSDSSLNYTVNHNTSREGKSIAISDLSNRNHILENSSNNTLRQRKQPYDITQSQSSKSQETVQLTQLEFSTTSATTLQERLGKDDFIYETGNSDQVGTTIPPQSPTVNVDIPHPKFKSSTEGKQKTRHAQTGASTTQSSVTDDSNEDSDSRAIDLLRSLYSLASKWG